MWEEAIDGTKVFVEYDMPLVEGENEDMIMQCENRNCEHKFQDERYGSKKRVFNVTMKKSGEKRVYRCTVCQHEQAEK